MRQSKLENACKMSHEVCVESQRLSKLATAFEESLRASRDSSDNGKKSNTSSLDSNRQIKACEMSEKSTDVSIMERCLAAMTQPDPCASGDHEEWEGKASDEDDDCSSLLASLSDLQTQLQQEIRQTQERLHDTHRTTKRGVEDTCLNSRTSFEQSNDSVRSRLEDTTTELSATANHTTTTTTTSATATTQAETTTTPATTTLSAATMATVSTTLSATTPAAISTTRTTTTTTGSCTCSIVD